MRKLIDKLIELPPDKWHLLTINMSWFFRTNGLKACPAIVVAGFEGREPTADEWKLVRKTTTAARKAALASEERVRKARARETRRQYMRRYMRERRGRPQA